jgi:RNA polymerase I-specific transcription initiation factor RRN6
MTKGVKHSDVTFNPWYADELAIVDTNGNTAVFEISPNSTKASHSTKEFRVANMRTCDFPSAHESDDDRSQNHPQRDWARVMWVTNPKTLLICTRTQLAMIDIKRQSTHEPPWHIPKLGLDETSNWILDIRRHPLHLNQVFVLTSTHVFWLYIGSEDDDYSENGLQCGANLVASIRHFRGQADVTLQLSVTPDGDGNG